jgi:hypothetical protein
MNAKLAKKHSHNPALLAAFQTAVLGRLKSWDAQHDIERITNTSMDGMDAGIAEFCAGCGDTFKPTPKMLETFLTNLEAAR